MCYLKRVPALLAAAALVVALAPRAEAQVRRGGAVGRAVPRAAVPRVGRPFIVAPRVIRVAPYRPYFYPYRPGLRIGLYGGYPYGYPYAYGYQYRYYTYPYAYPPVGYVGVVPGVAYGGVRIQGAPRNAQVFADGYYAGVVDDFDGTFQHLNLSPGPHRIEIRTPGAPPVAFDVRIEPGQTITYHAEFPTS